jgi:hypothetical protein
MWQVTRRIVIVSQNEGAGQNHDADDGVRLFRVLLNAEFYRRYIILRVHTSQLRSLS